jgi:hypothetical protein
VAEATGIAGAVQAAARAAGEAPAEPAQLELAGLPLAAVAEPAREHETPDSPRRGGRAPGTPNRRTQAWVEHILGRYRSPLVAMAETYSRPVEELARLLSCTRLEAFQLQLRAMQELAPYVHQKLPQAVQVEGKGVAMLAIVDPAALAGAAGPAAIEGELALDLNPAKSEG